MKTVVVAGAAGGIGASVVRALLAAGETTVVAISRSRERLDGLLSSIEASLQPRCTTIVANAGDGAGAQVLAGRIAALGGADAAVASLGRGWWTSGPILDLEPDEWTTVLDEMLTSHFVFARAMIPLLAARPQSEYLSIGGGAAFEPMRDAGLLSIAAAGQAMLARVLADERAGRPPRIRELVIDGPVNTSESRSFADAAWIRDDEAGRVVAELVLHGSTTWEPTRLRGPLVVMGARARP